MVSKVFKGKVKKNCWFWRNFWKKNDPCLKDATDSMKNYIYIYMYIYLCVCPYVLLLNNIIYDPYEADETEKFKRD
jgi:hypothetical protein